MSVMAHEAKPWLNGAVIGLDLLEIDRLEDALARQPALAERLFTDGERSYAATQGRPARHLAARFCAKEAVSKALEMDVLHPRDIEVVGGGDGPPRVTPARRGGRARGGARRRGPHLADAHEVDGGRGGGAAVTLAPWLQGLPDPERMRATDRWAIEELGIPAWSSWSAPGAGLADLVLAVAPDGPIAVVCGKGNNGGDGLVAARLLREPAARCACCAVAPVTS